MGRRSRSRWSTIPYAPGIDVTAILRSEPDVSYSVSMCRGGEADEAVVGDIGLCC